MFVSAPLPEITELIRSMGEDVVCIGENPVLPTPIASHADILCYRFDERSGYSYDTNLILKMHEFGKIYKEPQEKLGGKYPEDVRLNCLRLGGKLIANTKYCCAGILADAKKRGIEIIHVNQGYARCSVLSVTDSAVITSDTGIADTLSEYDIDVLLIRPGNITIPVYDYGFIGGASAKIGDSIVFCGDPLMHPDGQRMVEFIRAHGMDYAASGEHKLYDFGSCVEV